MARLIGLVPPIPTPFRDGALDLESFGRLLEHFAAHVSGYLVGGAAADARQARARRRCRDGGLADDRSRARGGDLARVRARRDGRRVRGVRAGGPLLQCALGAADYVAVIKTVVHARRAIDSAEVRLPLLPLAEARSAEVTAALAGVGGR